MRNMQLVNHVEYKEISILELGFSSRTYNALMRAGNNTLYLLIQNYEHLSEIRNLGQKGIDEINEKLNEITGCGTFEKDAVIDTLQQKNETEGSEGVDISGLSDDILNRPASDLFVPIRIERALEAAKINTIRQVLTLSERDILSLRDFGPFLQKQLLNEMRTLCELKEEYFERTVSVYPESTEEDRDPSLPLKGFDFATIDILTESFFFKPVWMTEWFGLSRQGIYNVLEKRSRLRQDFWTNKQMDENERSILVRMINEREFEFKDETVKCQILNNRKDDFVCLFVYEEQIKCFFLKDLPEEKQRLITESGFHKFTEKELAGGNEGKIEYCIRKPYFLPADMNEFRSNARSRGMTADDKEFI